MEQTGMELSATLFLVSVISLFGVGVYLIVGTLRGAKDLVDPSERWYAYFPYRWLVRMGKRSFYYFHIAIGIVFVIGAVVILFFILGYN
jgi:hypothetical protein